jgi:hypothetical protein
MNIAAALIDWHQALDCYRYPVDLRKFTGKGAFPDWFTRNLEKGDLSETISFETSFRESAATYLEPWYEVVFWKMYSMGMARNSQTERTIKRIIGSRTSASELWKRCDKYLWDETMDSFTRFQDLLVEGGSIASAFTFPAFSCPSRFPMVDTRTARYVAAEASSLGFSTPPKIDETLRRFRTGRSNVFLTLSDWPFIEEWVGWCRKMADQLSAHKKREWRARDVEMAVFRAWGERSERMSYPKTVPRYRLIDKLAQDQKTTSNR